MDAQHTEPSGIQLEESRQLGTSSFPWSMAGVFDIPLGAHHLTGVPGQCAGAAPARLRDMLDRCHVRRTDGNTTYRTAPVFIVVIIVVGVACVTLAAARTPSAAESTRERERRGTPTYLTPQQTSPVGIQSLPHSTSAVPQPDWRTSRSEPK